VSSAAHRAAFNLLCKLGARTVNGSAREYRRRGGLPGGRSPAATRALHEQIMVLKAKGYSRKATAAELGVSVNTVGLHWNGKIKAAR